MAVVAATAANARDVLVEGESGILAVALPWRRPVYEPSKRRLTGAGSARSRVIRLAADEWGHAERRRFCRWTRDRRDTDSPLEQAGFELLVPPEQQWLGSRAGSTDATKREQIAPSTESLDNVRNGVPRIPSAGSGKNSLVLPDPPDHSNSA
jgi:hypothetical protein